MKNVDRHTDKDKDDKEVTDRFDLIFNLFYFLWFVWEMFYEDEKNVLVSATSNAHDDPSNFFKDPQMFRKAQGKAL